MSHGRGSRPSAFRIAYPVSTAKSANIARKVGKPPVGPPKNRCCRTMKGDEREQQRQVRGDGHKYLQPPPAGIWANVSSKPAGPGAEPERDEQPAVVVAGRDAEEARVEGDVPVPESLPDGDRVEREIEQDGKDGVGEWRQPGWDAEPVRHEHRGGDDHRPGERDRHGDRPNLDEESLVIGVRTENRDIALLEEQPEGDGAEQLDETVAASRAIGKPRGEDEEDEHDDLDQSK